MIKLHSSPTQEAETKSRFLWRSAVRTLVTAVPAASLAGLLLTAVPAPVFSQSVPQVDVGKVAFGYRASKMFEREVVNSQGETIGEINDLVIDKQDVVYAIVEVGGFLGMGENLIAVPYDSLTLNDAGDKISLPGATKEELKKLPKFEYHK
jgi:sporulation protein YlmC with PRC-barrel domain